MIPSPSDRSSRDARAAEPFSASFVVGFVGGVGSGKSFVARQTTEQLAKLGVSFSLIDGDVVGHETLATPEVRDAIVIRFGDDVITNGEIDRRVLGSRVLGKDADEDALNDLERIMHPRMRLRFESMIAAAKSNDSVVLFDAAVLFEAGWNDLCDACVYVDVPAELRLARALTRGWTEERWQNTEERQWPLDRKRAAVESFGSAGLVVENGDDQPDVGETVMRWLMTVSQAVSCGNAQPVSSP